MRFFAASAFVAFGFLPACHSASDSAGALAQDSSVLMSNDFEHNIGWGGADLSSFSKEKAHSAHWSLRVTPESPYSFTFAQPLGELSSTPIQKMQLEAWVLRVAGGSTAQVVVQVDASKTDDKKVFYATLPLAEAVPTFGTWTAIHLPISLPTSKVGPAPSAGTG